MIAVFVAVLYRFGVGKKRTIIVNRAELIKAKMVKILQVNKVKLAILVQKNNIIGLVRKMGYYRINDKKIYALLYNPRLFWNIPRFWEKEVMIISEGNIEKIEQPRILSLLGIKTNRTINYLVVKEDYFLDQYFNCIINLTDKDALSFLNTKIVQDEAEIGSSVYVAQTMRLQAINLDEPFKTTNPDPAMVKRTEEIKNA